MEFHLVDISKFIFLFFIFNILQQSKNNSCFAWELLRPTAMPLIFYNVSSTCFNSSFTIKFKICAQQHTWNILHWSSFICQYRFNLDTVASLLEALSNVIVNILSRMPKSIISSFIKDVIFLPLCRAFIILNEIILLFNFHSLSI